MKVWGARINLSYVAVAIDSSWNLIEQAILNHWAILIESAPVCLANNVFLIDIFLMSFLIDIFYQSSQVLWLILGGALLWKMQIS
jgi:hypothetical protein